MANLESAIQHLLKAKRISAPSQSYRKDNPAEYAKVEAYLKGGARPTGVVTEMGLGLVEVEDVSRAVIPPDPPDPPPTTPEGPVTITQGGIYKGNWRSTSITPAVTINTSQAVVIEDSIIENTSTSSGAHLVSQSATGSQVTIRRCKLTGPANGFGRAIRGENFKSWVVENCTFTRTGGIYFLLSGPSATIAVRCNKMFNVQGDGGGNKRQFLQFNGVQGAGSVVAEWNQVINEPGLSYSEDVFSVFNSSGVILRNNYVQGGFPLPVQASHQGTGMLVSDVPGGTNNQAHDNQIIGITNVLMGTTGGHGNRIFNNTCVADGRLPDGTPLAAANNGIICYDYYGAGTMYDNKIYGNKIGAMQYRNGSLVRADYWCPAVNNDMEADNSFYYDNHSTPITKADEEAEWPKWLAKLAANNITIGA